MNPFKMKFKKVILSFNFLLVITPQLFILGLFNNDVLYFKLENFRERKYYIVTKCVLQTPSKLRTAHALKYLGT